MDGPLSRVAGEATDGPMGVYAGVIPMAAATLEVKGKRFELGFRWSRTNLESIGQIRL